MRRRILLFSLPALGILPLPPILFPPPPAPVPQPVPAPVIEITSGVAVEHMRGVTLPARCTGPQGSTCTGAIYLSDEGRRLTKTHRYTTLSAGEERDVGAVLRSRYELPTQALVRLTVVGGAGAARRVVVRPRNSTPQVTSVVAWVDRRGRTAVTVRCVPGIVRKRPCKGQSWLSSRRRVKALFNEPVPLTRIRRFALAAGSRRAIPLRLFGGLSEGVRKRRRAKLFAWIMSRYGGTFRSDLELRPRPSNH